MFEVRFHGRGGQGTVTAAELLSAAAFTEGMHAQAFPSFGSERTGAPVMSFCRIDDAPIRSREPVTRPDVLVIQDPTLLHQVNVFEGAQSDCRLLINSARPAADLDIGEFTGGLQPGSVLTVPATELAMQHLGRPVPSAALLGGFAALTGLVRLESVVAAIEARFAARPDVAAGNAQAARAAFDYVTDELAGLGITPPARPLITTAAGSPGSRRPARTARRSSRSRDRPESPRPSRAAVPR